MGVSDNYYRFNSLPFFYAPRRPWVRAYRWAERSPLGGLIDVRSGRFGPIRYHDGPYRSTLWPIRGSALLGALIALPFGRFGA